MYGTQVENVKTMKMMKNEDYEDYKDDEESSLINAEYIINYCKKCVSPFFSFLFCECQPEVFRPLRLFGIFFPRLIFFLWLP